MNDFMDEVMSWYTNEKDGAIALAKLSVIVFGSVFAVMLMPIWIFPYLIYKKVSK